MYSVILTELGISVFNDDKLEKAFPFSNPVKEYLLVKNRESKLNELINYLASIQRGVSVSDEALLAILKKFSIDCYLMDATQLDNVQATKPQIIVDSGFASNLQDTLGKLREFALGISSSKVTEVSESPDLHIIQAINSLDEIDKIANGLSSRLREWYGLHFPELDNIIDSINGYAQIVLAGKRESLTKQVFEEAGFPESKVEMLLLISSKSRGGDISDVNLAIVQSIAKQILDFHELRKKLEEHVETAMQEIAPNLSAILGSAVGARILGRAGSLKRLASLPASTIQVLGAEKALFRSLKTGSQPPKHGLLFQHAMVHAAPRWQRGKIARAVAAKAVIAARVDVYGEGLNQTLLEKLNIRVDEIGKKYENPTEKDLRKPQEFRRDGGNFGDRRREGGDRRREGGDRRREGGDRRREGGDRRREGGDRRREGGDRRREGGDRRREGGDRRREGGDRRREGGDRRREGGDRRREGGDRRREGGDRRREGGDRRREGGDRRREGGDRRREGGDRRREGGDRRREGGDRRREGGDRRREEGGSRNERPDSNKKRKKFGRR
ncbi:NOP5/NOP56 family protein [Nitrosopumilus adriaticus]|uniref:Pre-mRNA processing ribonucleoprotein, binding domain protein n=1 Tax=Nitrosopumilus adriaticus TaxID=1580092 RepID=A0A0D5C1H5_9ARCH|nr:ribonucleotide-diphosphate reductase subunit beta [Nitrosopumilus adriaticus]AJW70185.1 Pre-mRNA processing ribonucleoprotein, binding domain protein [Nitrosopumilus adriaticus]